MARNTIQIWAKIWNSSLQLSERLSTKRLKTCSRPTAHIAAKIAATQYSTPRSIQAKIFFKSARFSDLLEELLRSELLRQLVLRHDGRLQQRRLLGRRELVPLGEREDEEGRIHQVPGERDAAGDFVELEGNGRRHRMLITVQHAALQ